MSPPGCLASEVIGTEMKGDKSSVEESRKEEGNDEIFACLSLFNPKNFKGAPEPSP